MDDLEWFNMTDASPSEDQRTFLSALRDALGDKLRPHCPELSQDSLLLILDVDAPGRALVNVGVALSGRSLRGDRMSIHHYGFPRVPSDESFVAEGDPVELADAARDFFLRAAARPVVRHDWTHRGRVYAACYVFEDTGERLAQAYRREWAPAGQEAALIAGGFVHGKGWIQTAGLGEPSRIVYVRGARADGAHRSRRWRPSRVGDLAGLKLWYSPYPSGGPEW